MDFLIEKYLDVNEVEAIKNMNQLDEETYDELKRYLVYHLKQKEKYNEEEEGYEVSLLDDATEYVKLISTFRDEGYGFHWAKAYASTTLEDENRNPASKAYTNEKKIDSERAMQDLKLYAKKTGKDEYFVKHFHFLSEVEAPNVSPSFEQQATTYSEIYKNEIAKGNSDVFAKKYAGCIAGGDHTELGCYAEAKEFEKCIVKGDTKEFAEVYAMKMAEYIANYCSSYEASLDDELVNVERETLRHALPWYNDKKP